MEGDLGRESEDWTIDCKIATLIRHSRVIRACFYEKFVKAVQRRYNRKSQQSVRMVRQNKVFCSGYIFVDTRELFWLHMQGFISLRDASLGALWLTLFEISLAIITIIIGVWNAICFLGNGDLREIVSPAARTAWMCHEPVCYTGLMKGVRAFLIWRPAHFFPYIIFSQADITTS